MTEGIKRLAKVFAVKHTERERRLESTASCWICLEGVCCVKYAGRYELCFECAEVILKDVLLPRLAEGFVDVETRIRERLERQAAKEKSENPTHLSSPLGSNQSSTLPWKCPKCTLENSAFSETCAACETPKFAHLCPLCMRDFVEHKVCRYNRQPHVLWECLKCHVQNLEEFVECRDCTEPRTWFCGACSYQNPHGNKTCQVCDGKQRLSSLHSFVNREVMKDTGLSVDEADEEKRKANEVAIHTEQLKLRLESMDVDPIEISDDGNCLFRALSYQLVRDISFHGVVRRMVVEYIRNRPDEYAAFIGTNEFASYIDNMSSDRYWGDEMCVQAAAHVFDAAVHLVTSEEGRWHLRYKVHEHESQHGRHLFLAYIRPIHYYCFTLHQDVTPVIVDLESVLLSYSSYAPKSAAPAPVTVYVQGSQPSSPVAPASHSQRKSIRPISVPLSRYVAPCEYLRIGDLAKLRHAPVVVLHTGQTNFYLSTAGNKIQLTRFASRFYLFPLSVERIRDNPPADSPFSSIGNFFNQLFTGNSGKAAASSAMPVFLLQDVYTGHFIQCPHVLKDEQVMVGHDKHVMNYGDLVCAPLTRNTTLAECAITIDRPRTVSRSIVQLRFACAVSRAVYWSFNSDSLYCSSLPRTSCPFGIQVLCNGRPERLCLKCKQWYMDGDQGNFNSPGQCVHESLADQTRAMIA